jgi:hypothetical protein
MADLRDRTPSARDIRREHRVLAALDEAALDALELLPEGAPLRRYGVYLDLHDPGRADFTAEGSEQVKPGQRLVAREGTDPEVWEALRRACAQVVGRGRPAGDGQRIRARSQALE